MFISTRSPNLRLKIEGIGNFTNIIYVSEMCLELEILLFSTLPGTSLGCGRFSRSEAGPWDLYVSQVSQMIVVLGQVLGNCDRRSWLKAHVS